MLGLERKKKQHKKSKRRKPIKIGGNNGELDKPRHQILQNLSDKKKIETVSVAQLSSVQTPSPHSMSVLQPPVTNSGLTNDKRGLYSFVLLLVLLCD